MKILITNTSLNRRTGAHLFVRDLAKGLQARGHEVLAFCSILARSEPLLDADSIETVTDLNRTSFVPDVIHGQCNMDAMTAITAYPETPAIFHMHGAGWKDSPAVHPRIHRYFSITPTLKERVMIEFAIPESKIHVLPNGVDIERFSMVRAPSTELKRAVIYNRFHSHGSPTRCAIESACERLGISLEVVGQGQIITEPEKELSGFDLVFACGMSAIDAAACGCAVIILGQSSCGPMLDMENFAKFRAANFSIPVNSGTATSDFVERELLRYSPIGAGEVTRLVRREASFDRIVDAILRHYEEVMVIHRSWKPDKADERASLVEYLQRLAPLARILDNFDGRSRSVPFSMEEVLGGLQRDLTRLEMKMKEYL